MSLSPVVLVATANKKKLEELRTLLSGLNLTLKCLAELPHYTAVLEDGKTFEENAVKKALGYARQSGLLTLAEDSGLCCEALEGAPGIYSARFSGPEATDSDNNHKLLKLFEKIPDNCRSAWYHSVVAIATPEKILGIAEGKVFGLIHKQLEGNQGFGYDPLFYYPPFRRTFGCVSAKEKHAVSHRAIDLQKAKELLLAYVNGNK